MSDAQAMTAIVNTDNWPKRRRVIYWSLFFSAANLVYLVLFAPNDGLRQNLAVGFLSAAVAIIGSYVFGAVFDDKNKFAAMTAIQKDAPEAGAN